MFIHNQKHNMKRIKNKKTWTCWCWRELKKSEFKRWTTQGQPYYICPRCWYFNSPCIFTEYIEVKKQELIFWQPIKN